METEAASNLCRVTQPVSGEEKNPDFTDSTITAGFPLSNQANTAPTFYLLEA